MAIEPATKADGQSATLYERDPYTWALEQACALRERRQAALDWDNLAEEIDDLAGRHRDALRSNYEVLLEHLLKIAYARPSARRNNNRLWRLHARNARMRISDLLDEKPGLRSARAEAFAKAWPYARNNALAALGLDDDSIPERCPWTLDQVSDERFWPAAAESAALKRR